MAKSMVLGCTVEQDGDNLVITLSGALAASTFKQLSADGGGHAPILSALLSRRFLGSPSVRLSGHRPAVPEQPDLKEIFGQGFDRDLNTFNAQLDEYRKLLAPEGGAGRGRAKKTKRPGTRSAKSRTSKAPKG